MNTPFLSAFARSCGRSRQARAIFAFIVLFAFVASMPAEPRPNGNELTLQDGTRAKVEGQRLVIVGRDGKQSPAPPGHYVTREGRQFVVEANGLVNTGSAASDQRRSANPFPAAKQQASPPFSRASIAPPPLAASPRLSPSEDPKIKMLVATPIPKASVTPTARPNSSFTDHERQKIKSLLMPIPTATATPT
ncbi:MAG: hypothetical protein M3Z64_09295, partial [Verrucomicrobiota bacterium]|nr:hypothetical protein [Verrucomicrobiota bacterium]